MKKSKKKLKVNISPPSSSQEIENSDSGDILSVGITSDTEDEYKDSDLVDVILDIGTSESEIESDSSSDSDVASIFTRTRTGRTASTWKIKKYM
ncbi:hypothetical protein JTE90_004847 [Oedothorax gibbosus]|uniref:Uncharacterized protein n=1 Tax=Oedothorax gibbosus TaxID=931172 RepID=A0AAV6UUA1_9ARAC|nr:hypothetical protein JTE90_004847 [Oedothorax gibbosus]